MLKIALVQRLHKLFLSKIRFSLPWLFIHSYNPIDLPLIGRV